MTAPVLIQSNTQPEVYLLIRNQKRHIPDMETFNAFEFNGSDIIKITDTLINSIPSGDVMPSIKSITSCPTGITCSGTSLTENEKKMILAYKIYLNREPDQGGFSNYVSSLSGATSISQIINSFVNSPEFGGITAFQTTNNIKDIITQQITPLQETSTQYANTMQSINNNYNDLDNSVSQYNSTLSTVSDPTNINKYQFSSEDIRKKLNNEIAPSVEQTRINDIKLQTEQSQNTFLLATIVSSSLVVFAILLARE
jgi:hypothetical protein